MSTSNSDDSLRIFVVEDDPMYTRMLQYLLKLNPDHEVQTFHSGKELIDQLHQAPDVVIIDYQLPDMTGLQILRRVKTTLPDATCIVLSGQKEISVAVELLREGAYDYVIKDEDAKDRILNMVQMIVKNKKLAQENTELRRELVKTYEFEKSMVGQSDSMQQVYHLLRKAAQSDINVSIFGETGTGKEVAAKAIHYNSRRAKQPFIAVNMAAIPHDLMESELFGHEKGAFTGAIARRKGKFEMADKGTLFLDEIAEMDINLQAKLLRVIQERELVRVGGEETVKFDCRIIVATHKNLGDEIAAGHFREDLYYRLLGLSIPLPPLRQRGQDIILLAKFFLDQFAESNRLGKLSLSEDARKKLLGHSYPGNVRELRAAIELAAVMAENGSVRAEDITFHSLQKDLDLLSEELTLDEYTQRIVNHFLDKYDHNVVKVAQKLGIGKSTLYRMLKQTQEPANS